MSENAILVGPPPQVAGPFVDIERRRITAMAAMALLGGAAITLSGCGGGGSSPAQPSAGPAPTPTPPPASGCAADASCGLVSGDPLHSAVVTAAQLSAGNALTLDIQGAAGHSHSVTLSPEEVVSIRERRRVEKFSSETLTHSHTVTFN